MSRKISDNKYLWLTAGIFWGAAMTFVCGVLYLRSALIHTESFRIPYDSFVKKLPGEKPEGWLVRKETCLIPSAPDGTPVSVFRFCKKDYAELLLSADKANAALLPCSAAVWRAPDGSVVISRLNMNLLSRLLGGPAGKLFHWKILPEQQRFLENTAKK